MASRRTISYIGLWALIMPWLGFSWGTKTVLFSLTGILLLIIGNRHYHSNKSKQTKEPVSTPKTEPTVEIIKESPKIEEPYNPVYRDVPEYMNPSPATNSTNSREYSEPAVFTEEEKFVAEDSFVEPTVIEAEEISVTIAEKPKSRIRRKIEISPRQNRTTPKPISLDSLDTEDNYEQNEI